MLYASRDKSISSVIYIPVKYSNVKEWKELEFNAKVKYLRHARK